MQFGDDLVVLALIRQRNDAIEVGRGDDGGPEPFRLTLRDLGGCERLARLPGQPLGLEQPAQAAENRGVAGAKGVEIAVHGEGLVRIAPLLQGMGQLMGGFGSDRSCRRVEANGLVEPAPGFQHLPQLVVDPDITGIELLGPPQHRLGHREIAHAIPHQSGAQQVQADRAQLLELGRPGQGPQCLLLMRPR